MHVEIYDTTLRDGAQAEDIAFSVEDKLRIVKKLDELGVHYVEGGWPGANPRDVEFFKKVQDLRLVTSQVVAFGSTRRANNSAADDPNLQALLHSGTDLITIFILQQLILDTVHQGLIAGLDDIFRNAYCSPFTEFITRLDKHADASGRSLVGRQDTNLIIQEFYTA